MYTVSPNEGYLVRKEYTPTMNTKDMTTHELDMVGRDYVKENKSYLGRGDDPRRQVLQTHEEMSELHGATTRVVVTSSSPMKTQATGGASEAIRNMEAEASRISERLVSGIDSSANETINRTYENLKK